MNQAVAILWAQWRSMRNFFPRGGIGWTAAVGFIWYGIWALVSFSVMLLISSPMVSTMLGGVLLLAFMYWQVVPVLMAASGASLDLRKLQAYPISVSQLFGLEVILRITAVIEVVMVLTGTGIGILRNPATPARIRAPPTSAAQVSLSPSTSTARKAADTGSRSVATVAADPVVVRKPT